MQKYSQRTAIEFIPSAVYWKRPRKENTEILLRKEEGKKEEYWVSYVLL